MDKMRMETPDLTAANVEKIGALFPNCITEMADANSPTQRVAMKHTSLPGWARRPLS